jgi:probable F420-dependent oxidoreductase
VALHLGVSFFATDFSIQPGDLARACEERGFESVWVSEHTHIPVHRRVPWPGGPVLPEEYSHTYDPFVALTAVAIASPTLKLGTGVCLVGQHHPINLAKAVASVDYLSGGRVIFGIGGGWNYEEMEHHGTSYALRWRVMRERIAAMKELWTKDVAEYHGKYVDFAPSYAWPKPAQKPYPPILLGGDGPTTHDRVIEYCDGWVPMPHRTLNKVPLPDRIQALRARARELGRDPDTISVTAFWAKAERDVLDQLEAAGCERAVFQLPALSKEEAIPVLDRFAEMVR